METLLLEIGSLKEGNDNRLLSKVYSGSNLLLSVAGSACMAASGIFSRGLLDKTRMCFPSHWKPLRNNQ